MNDKSSPVIRESSEVIEAEILQANDFNASNALQRRPYLPRKRTRITFLDFLLQTSSI